MKLQNVNFCFENLSCKFENNTTSTFAAKIRAVYSKISITCIFAVRIRVENFEMHRTRIFDVKIRVAYFKIEQLRFWRWKSELEILKCTHLGFVSRKKIRIGVLYKPRYIFFCCEFFTIGFEIKKMMPHTVKIRGIRPW